MYRICNYLFIFTLTIPSNFVPTPPSLCVSTTGRVLCRLLNKRFQNSILGYPTVLTCTLVSKQSCRSTLSEPLVIARISYSYSQPQIIYPVAIAPKTQIICDQKHGLTCGCHACHVEWIIHEVRLECFQPTRRAEIITQRKVEFDI